MLIRVQHWRVSRRAPLAFLIVLLTHGRNVSNGAFHQRQRMDIDGISPPLVQCVTDIPRRNYNALNRRRADLLPQIADAVNQAWNGVAKRLAEFNC